jgi:hypothetical protein
VGLIVTIDRQLEAGSWLDLGMFIQNVTLAAAGRGLQSSPQETFSKYHRTLRPPALDSGGADSGVSRGSDMPPAHVDEFATFLGLDE